jgi:hypothetical protein
MGIWNKNAVKTVIIAAKRAARTKLKMGLLFFTKISP